MEASGFESEGWENLWNISHLPNSLQLFLGRTLDRQPLGPPEGPPQQLLELQALGLPDVLVAVALEEPLDVAAGELRDEGPLHGVFPFGHVQIFVV